jgi:nucleoside 2-deoxyribosyltransferase
LLVYLAGPMVFSPGPPAVFDRMKAICAAQGLQGVAPLDNQIDLPGAAPDKSVRKRTSSLTLSCVIDVRRFKGGGLRPGEMRGWE